MLGSPDWFVDVTDLVRDCLRIDNSRVAALHEQNYVVGLEAGVTSLNVSILKYRSTIKHTNILMTPLYHFV